MSIEEMDFTDARMLRKKAEELMESRVARAFIPGSKIGKKKLLYELQIHQIEQELQNEALHQANITAELALKKYTMLFELAAMGYFLIEPEGTISELNFTGAEMLHERRFVLKGANFNLFVARESKALFKDFLIRIYTTRAKESCKIMLGYEGSSLCSTYIEGIVAEDEQKCLLSVVNLSKLKIA